MKIEIAKSRRAAVIDLLASEKLPTDDLPENLDNFVIAVEDEEVIGVAGIELYKNHGLLRSLAVAPSFRNQGIAGKLLERIESFAVSIGLTGILLLTETAPDYFTAKGFQRIARDNVPDEVKKSSEFSHVCPVSAIVMRKELI